MVFTNIINSGSRHGVCVVIFFKTMYNKTTIRFSFCDILNNQGLGKCYIPWKLVIDTRGVCRENYFNVRKPYDVSIQVKRRVIILSCLVTYYKFTELCYMEHS